MPNIDVFIASFVEVSVFLENAIDAAFFLLYILYIPNTHSA